MATAADGDLRVAPTSLAVIVVTYNSKSVLAPLLASLDKTITTGIRTSLVVVDNASQDGTAEVARQLAPHAAVIARDTNDGYAAGINVGIRAAGAADAYLILNPDIRLGDESVQWLLETLRLPDTGIAVPRIHHPDGTLAYSLRREPTLLRALGELALGAKRAGRIPWLGEEVSIDSEYRRAATSDWATGAVWLLHGECIAALGDWDESYFLYSEETDYALRAKDNGFVLRYCPHAQVEHVGGDYRIRSDLYSMLVINRIRCYRKRHRALSSAVFAALVASKEVARASAGRRISGDAVRSLLWPSSRPSQLADRRLLFRSRHPDSDGGGRHRRREGSVSNEGQL